MKPPPSQALGCHSKASFWDSLLKVCEVNRVATCAFRPITVLAEQLSPDLPRCFIFFATHTDAFDVFCLELDDHGQASDSLFKKMLDLTALLTKDRNRAVAATRRKTLAPQRGWRLGLVNLHVRLE